MEGAAPWPNRRPDFIDINCGCYEEGRVARAGAGLLRTSASSKPLCAAFCRTRPPVTVKTRLGWDAANIIILDVARMLEDLGVH